MNGKTLLLALVFGAAVVAFLICSPAGDGTSREAETDSGRIYANAGETSVSTGRAGEENGVADPEKKFSGSSKSLARLGLEKPANTESAAVREKLREMQRTDDEGLEMVTMPDGHQSIHLQGRFQHVTRLVTAEDGRLVPMCGGYLPGEKQKIEDE